MENQTDYSKTLAEAKRLKLLNEIVLKEIVRKQDEMEKSIVEINSLPKPKVDVENKVCKCGK